MSWAPGSASGALRGEASLALVTEGARRPWAGGIKIASRAGSLLVVIMRLPCGPSAAPLLLGSQTSGSGRRSFQGRDAGAGKRTEGHGNDCKSDYQPAGYALTGRGSTALQSFSLHPLTSSPTGMAWSLPAIAPKKARCWPTRWRPPVPRRLTHGFVRRVIVSLLSIVEGRPLQGGS